MALQAGLSSSDYLALVELHLRNMLATVEGMEEEEEVMLATMKGPGNEKEVGRLLLFQDTGILKGRVPKKEGESMVFCSTPLRPHPLWYGLFFRKM